MHCATRVIVLILVTALAVGAEEFAMKDGTKIIGHMTAIKGDKIEVQTNYGKMLLKRSDVLTISFPENDAENLPAEPAETKKAPKIEEFLDGTQYLNKTGKFSLTLPPGWRINRKSIKSSAVNAVLTSKDNLSYVLVVQEEYSGSLEDYKQIMEVSNKTEYQDYEALSESHSTIDEKPALIFSYKHKADKLSFRYLAGLVTDGKTMTRIVAYCFEPLFQDSQLMFDKILHSYRVVGDAPSPAPASHEQERDRSTAGRDDSVAEEESHTSAVKR